MESRWSGVSVSLSEAGGHSERSEGGSDSVEGIGRSERRKSGLSDEIAVDEGIPQKGVEEVGDGHLPRKKEGPNETGKDVESQRGTFSRTGAVVPRRRSTTRKKGSPHERWMVKSPGPKRAMSSSSLAGLRGNEESEREGDPSGRGEERTVGLEISEADEELARRRHDWLVAWCLVRPA